MKLEPVKSVSGISTKEFLVNYFKPKIPIIIKDFVDSDSPALKKWDFDFFRDIAGDQIVQVYGREEETISMAASKPVTQMKFGEYLDLIEQGNNHYRLFLFNILKEKPELMDDIHYRDITDGKVLKWLPFMFFGGEGSATRNHFDIDMSHVIKTQYYGTKRIWLYPPSATPFFYKPPLNFHSLANPRESTIDQYPGLEYLEGYEAIIHPGDTLLMPSGWWHYVQYETGGFSVSIRALGNWMDRIKGMRNILIYKNIDDLLRKTFKDKWFNYKVEVAHKRAQEAIKKISTY